MRWARCTQMDEEGAHQNSFLDVAANGHQRVLIHKSAAWLYNTSGSRLFAEDSSLPGFGGSRIPMLGGQARQASTKSELCRGQQGRQHLLEDFWIKCVAL